MAGPRYGAMNTGRGRFSFLPARVIRRWAGPFTAETPSGPTSPDRPHAPVCWSGRLLRRVDGYAIHGSRLLSRSRPGRATRPLAGPPYVMGNIGVTAEPLAALGANAVTLIGQQISGLASGNPRQKGAPGDSLESQRAVRLKTSDLVFLSRLFVPRGVRRAIHPAPYCPSAGDAKVDQARPSAMHSVSNAVDSVERSVKHGTAVAGRRLPARLVSGEAPCCGRR